MNNILTVVRGYTEMLLHQPEDFDPADDAQTLLQSVDDLCTLGRKLTQIGRLGATGEVGTFDLADVVRRTAATIEGHPKLQGCRISVMAPPRLPFDGNLKLISRMLVNLLLNAGDATDHRGDIQVRLARTADGVRLEVHDNGPGVPDEVRSQLFEAFFTTKTDGTGLGLLSVQVCVREHHGEVAVERSELGGACFRVALRGARPAQASRADSLTAANVSS